MRFRVAGVVLIAVHLAIVWWLTLRPHAVPWVDAANVQPFSTLRSEFDDDPRAALRSIGESLLLLAPAGFLLPLAGGRLWVSVSGSFTRTVFAGGILALGMELLKTGVPGQVANVDALLLHTAGIALAHLAVVPGVRARLRRRLPDAAPEDSGSQGGTPRMTGVGIAP